MPFPRAQLDLVVAPSDIDRPFPTDAMEALLSEWRDRGILEGTTAGPNASALVAGGFRAVRVERPDGVHLWTNHQGGFRASCPRCGTLGTGAFSSAVTEWRAGAPRRWTCPTCTTEQPLEAAVLEPPGAFARWALVVGGVADAELSEGGRAAIEMALGLVRVVWRRIG